MDDVPYRREVYGESFRFHDAGFKFKSHGHTEITQITQNIYVSRYREPAQIEKRKE